MPDTPVAGVFPQAVTRYTISALDGAEAAGSPSLLTINVRDAFVAPAGKLLLSADYSQVELRLLAHFRLVHTLCLEYCDTGQVQGHAAQRAMLQPTTD